MAEDKSFQTYREFLDSVAQAKHSTYAYEAAIATPEVSEFSEMQNYILKRGQGIEVPHSFMDDNGQIFDCVPTGQQPSLKDSGQNPATPPDLPVDQSTKDKLEPAQIDSTPDAQRSDRFGNKMQCPPGTVPIRRVTLDELTRFSSMSNFFRKTPVGKGRHPRLSLPQVASGVHKYAHAYQQVSNLGGHSFVNVWDPAVGNQIFSLSQHWYAGGTPVQTVECGWQVYPQKYGSTKPVLFIYWTADDYKNTGCYNLECTAFVQTNSQWALGSTLNTISVPGGAQAELEMAWNLAGGNWWLYLNGTASANAVGYFPSALFGGGQLSQFATDIDYGGETVNQVSWPPMGSGNFANGGYQNAAYQRNIFYFDTNGNAQPAVLTPTQPSPNCYTIDLPAPTNNWGTYFFFGGPGGNAC